MTAGHRRGGHCPSRGPGAPSRAGVIVPGRDSVPSVNAGGLMSRLRFGIFLAPFHPAGENPTLALERDLELVEHLDRLGYDEAWIGEHHSAGSEIIASPEILIAAAAQRPRPIPL